MAGTSTARASEAAAGAIIFTAVSSRNTAAQP
jgi:hypothetical protein